jgi:hypothetical protein
VDTTPQTTKAALRRPLRKSLICLGEFGAGEGIRTLDPNLGNVPQSFRCSAIDFANFSISLK